jgi:hypothetical protein
MARHPTVTYPPPPTNAEIAEIRRRIIEHRMHPVSAALWNAARDKLERETAGQGQVQDDLYRRRTGKVRLDSL